MGNIKQHEAMAACEKPIIAKVNGNAFGNSLGIVLACDLIVARDDALMVDYHMGLDTWPSEHAPDISRFVEASEVTESSRSTAASRGFRSTCHLLEPRSS